MYPGKRIRNERQVCNKLVGNSDDIAPRIWNIKSKEIGNLLFLSWSKEKCKEFFWGGNLLLGHDILGVN